ncbi:MAG: hypothetical protein K0R92_550 [Lachnospiraceae bacterium]|jgi:hypothetical protein|nr:hypothetical protein [Lachnospiraceae bacterium]
MTKYYDYDPEEIYDRDVLGEETTEEKIEQLRGKNYSYVVKTIVSGPVVECEIYPVFTNKKNLPRRNKEKTSRNVQKNLNDKNAKKKVSRLVNANFTSKDLAVTLTYTDHYLPNEKQARKDVTNFLRRVSRYRKKHGLPDLKYIYVIGCVDDEERKHSKKVRIHHHLIINDMDRDVVEGLWGKGRAEAKRLQPDDFGLEGIARYMAGQNNGSKRWYASRNLDQPKVYRSFTKLTKKKAEQMYRTQADWEETFEKIYKGKYKYLDCKPYESDFTGGFYLYARMRKRE